jgi:hypothetical protein
LGVFVAWCVVRFVVYGILRGIIKINLNEGADDQARASYLARGNIRGFERGSGSGRGDHRRINGGCLIDPRNRRRDRNAG